MFGKTQTTVPDGRNCKGREDIEMTEQENTTYYDYQGNIADESVADDQKREVSPAPVKMSMDDDA